MKSSAGIKKLRPIEFVYILMVIGMAIAPNTIVGYFFCSFFVLYLVWYNKGKWRISYYFFFELLLIFYLVVQIFIGIDYEIAQFTGIRLLIVSIIFNISLYQFIVCCGINRAADLYATGNIIGDFIIFLFYSETFFKEGGLSAAQFKGVSFLKIGGVASVNIGWVNVIAIVLLWPNYLKTRDKKILLKVGILLLFSVLTGRRKIFLLLFTSLIVGTYLFYSVKGLKKAVKGIVLAGVVTLIGWVLIMKLPVLYNFIGYRLQVALNAVLKIYNGEDSSINLRYELVNKAVLAWQNNMFLGQGYNAFSVIYNGGGYYCHNNYLELLVSFGLVGTVIYYSKYIYIFVKLYMLKFQKKIPQWYSNYYVINFIAFCFLEFYQVTYIYRSLTIVMVFMVFIINNNGIYGEYNEEKNKLPN